MKTTTEKMTIYSSDSINLQQELKKLSREITRLNDEKRHLPFSQAGSYVREAEIDLLIIDLNSERTEIGKRLLEIQNESDKSKKERAKAAEKERDSLIDSHLNRLTSFVKQAKMLDKIATEYEALVEESKTIQSLNNRAVMAGLASRISGLSPKSHADRFRKHLIATFDMSILAGINPVRDAQHRGFDIMENTEATIKTVLGTGYAEQ